MSTEYPMYIMDGGNLIVIVNPVLAYRYKDYRYYNDNRNGFEFQEYTTRKMVQKFEKSGEPMTVQQFAQFLMAGIGVKLRGCVNAILKADLLISKEDENALTALKYETFTHSKRPHAL